MLHFLVSPHYQLESGVAHDDIICRDDLVLVFRTNGAVACVNNNTSEHFGWKKIEKLSDSIVKIDTKKSIIIKSSGGAPNSLDFVTFEISHYPKLNEIATVTVTSTNPYQHDLTLTDNEYLIIRISDGFEFANVPAEQIQIRNSTYGTDYYIQEPLLAQQDQTQSLTVDIKSITEGKQKINVSGAAGDDASLVLFVDAVEGLPYSEYIQNHPDVLAQLISRFSTNNAEPFPTPTNQTTPSTSITEDELREILRSDGYTEEEIDDIVHPK